MTETQERELLDSIGAAIKLANDGMDPSAAIAKVASQKRYPWDFTSRMVEAFNTSKTCRWLETTQGQEKAASFRIADPEVVRKLMYPETIESHEKAAGLVPLECRAPEVEFFELRTEKAAGMNRELPTPVTSWVTHDMNMLFGQAQKEAAAMDRRVAEARTQVAIARASFDGALRKLAAYFRQMPHEPFEYVEKVASGTWGGVSTLMDIVYQMSGAAKFGEKRAAEHVPRTVAPDREPYTFIRDVLEKRATHQQTVDKLRELETAASSYRERLTGLETRCAIKAAGMADLGDAVFSTLKGKSLPAPAMSAPDDAHIQKKIMGDLADPQLAAETDALDAQLMLHQLMTQDPVLAGRDPNEVVAAYNMLSQSSPRVTQSPIALQSALRKYLETGGFDTMDVASLASTEKSLGDAQQMQGDRMMLG